MEIIVFPIAFFYFLYLHRRDRREAKQRKFPVSVVLNVERIETDENGRITTIYARI